MPLSQAEKTALVADAQAFLDACNALVPDTGPPPPPPPPPPTVITVGARVKVTASAKVRATPDAAAPGLPGSPQPIGALGTVIGALTNGYWQVDWDTGADGWTWAANIALAP